MRPLSVVPQQVPAAVVRPVFRGAEETVAVQHVEVGRVPAPLVIPRQAEGVNRR